MVISLFTVISFKKFFLANFLFLNTNTFARILTQKLFSIPYQSFQKNMLQSTSINIQHIHTPPHTQLNLVLALQHTKKTEVMTVATQRKISLENDRKKWDVTEFREWLCFVLRYNMKFPYQNIQNVLMSSKNGGKIFDDLSRTILTKTSKECSKFSRRMIKEMRSRTDQGLLKWSLNKLKKQVQNPQIAELISKYEAFSQNKSAYMQILAKMDKFYDSQQQ